MGSASLLEIWGRPHYSAEAYSCEPTLQKRKKILGRRHHLEGYVTQLGGDNFGGQHPYTPRHNTLGPCGAFILAPSALDLDLL